MAANRTIMLVDNDTATQKEFVTYFKSKGYNPVSVIDPRTIAGHLKKGVPDVILMEIVLEQMRGDSVIRALRKRGIQIPVIVVSSVINKELIVKLNPSNVSAYFTKPVNFDKLNEKIQSLLATRQTQRKSDSQSNLLLITESESVNKDPYSFIPRTIIEKHKINVILNNSFLDSVKMLQKPSNKIRYVMVDASNQARTLTIAKILKRVMAKHDVPAYFIADTIHDNLKSELLKLGMGNIILRKKNYESSFDAVLTNAQNVSKKNTTVKKSNILSDLKSIKTLPPLPDIYLKIENLAQNPSATTAEYSKILELDQGITTRLLRMSNSAIFSFKRKIKSVKDAVSLMGIREIVSLVRIACITGNLKASPRVQKPIKKIWKHSATCAITAKLVYEKTDICLAPDLAEELFISGIIHDLGKVVLMQFYTDQYMSFLGSPGISIYPNVSEEKELLGATHTEVGMAIANHWKLPEPLRDVIAYHHNPMLREESDLVTIIHISDAISKIVMGNIPEDYDLGLDAELLKKIDYTSEQIRELAQELGPEITRMTANAAALITG